MNTITPKCSIYNVSFEKLFPVIPGDSLGYLSLRRVVEFKLSIDLVTSMIRGKWVYKVWSVITSE